MFVARFVVKGKRERAGCFALSSWCLVIGVVLWLLLTVPWVGLQFVIVVFPDHTHLLFKVLKKRLIAHASDVLTVQPVAVAALLKHWSSFFIKSSSSILDGVRA